MGICTSIDAASIPTAKLILPDGTLQQYTHPVKAHYVLQKFKNAAFCICNSDEMDFNDVVSALRDDEVLQLDELYFVLPLSYLKRPIKAEEMAELAVRASAALMEGCGGSVGNAWLCDENLKVNVGGAKSDNVRRRSATENGGRRRRGRTYSTDLSAIAE